MVHVTCITDESTAKDAEEEGTAAQAAGEAAADTPQPPAKGETPAENSAPEGIPSAAFALRTILNACFLVIVSHSSFLFNGFNC